MNVSNKLEELEKDLNLMEVRTARLTSEAEMVEKRLEDAFRTCLAHHDELGDVVLEAMKLGKSELEETIRDLYYGLNKIKNEHGVVVSLKAPDPDHLRIKENPPSDAVPGSSRTCSSDSLAVDRKKPGNASPTITVVDKPMTGGSTSVGGRGRIISTKSTIQQITPPPRPIQVSPPQAVGQTSSTGMGFRKPRNSNAPRGGGRPTRSPSRRPIRKEMLGNPEELRLNAMVDDDWEKETVAQKPLPPPQDKPLVLYDTHKGHFEGKKSAIQYTQLPN
ncbi:unnamed protein product [Orchesella dallaii]|uniref:Uncharacterized protein n=1 Tax=Orchesella dallaii TaxID=48710 RepID=A0ABP1PLD4_9HEXA